MRTGFTSRFRKWIRVLATGRLLLFQVGSRYLEAISHRQEDREPQMEEMKMANALLDYGDGGDWVGKAKVQAEVTVAWQIDFDSSSSSVEIHIGAQDADVVAKVLRDAWHDVYPNEASINLGEPSIVRFVRNGKKPRCMSIRVGTGARQTLPQDGTVVTVVSELHVRNVQ